MAQQVGFSFVAVGVKLYSGGHGATAVWLNKELLMVAGGGGYGHACTKSNKGKSQNESSQMSHKVQNDIFDLSKGIPVRVKCLRGDGASLNKSGQVYFDRLLEADCLSDTGIGGSGTFPLDL